MTENIFQEIRNLKEYSEQIHDALDKIPEMLDLGPNLASYDILTRENQGTPNPEWREKCDEWILAKQKFEGLLNTIDNVSTEDLIKELKTMLIKFLEVVEWNKSLDYRRKNERLLLEKLLQIIVKRKIYESADILNQYLDANIWPIQVIDTLGIVGNQSSVEKMKSKMSSKWDLEAKAAGQAWRNLQSQRSD